MAEPNGQSKTTLSKKIQFACHNDFAYPIKLGNQVAMGLK
jgi:hypothetical protein